LDLVISERKPDGQCAILEEKLKASQDRVKEVVAKRQERKQEPENGKAKVEGKPHETASKSVQNQTENASGDVIGYMPLRGDFNVEYDNDAELILADMEFFDDDKKSETDLKYEVLKLYNSKLDERIRRKKFIIDNSLVDIKKILQQEMKRSKEEREVYALLRPFQRFCTGDEYQRLAQGYIQERTLRQRLEELKKFK
jgi:transcriptional adapter 2-alpha